MTNSINYIIIYLMDESFDKADLSAAFTLGEQLMQSVDEADAHQLRSFIDEVLSQRMQFMILMVSSGNRENLFYNKMLSAYGDVGMQIVEGYLSPGRKSESSEVPSNVELAASVEQKRRVLCIASLMLHKEMQEPVIEAEPVNPFADEEPSPPLPISSNPYTPPVDLPASDGKPSFVRKLLQWMRSIGNKFG